MKAKSPPSSSRKSSSLPDQGFFEIVLGVLVLEVEELQHERVLDLFLGREEVARLRLRPLRSIAALFRESKVRS